MPKKKRADTEAKDSRRRKKIVLKKTARPAGLLAFEDVLRKVNFIQTEREPAKFSVSLDDAPTVENVLRDAGLVINKIEGPSFVIYEVSPGAPVIEGQNALENLDEMSDEIPEDGQCFD